MKKELGKIESAKFGMGGYQDCQFGLSIDFSGNSWGVSDFKGGWGVDMDCSSESCKWDEVDRSKWFDETCRFVSQILMKAKKQYISQLVGVPVEVTFDGNSLRDWRILEEVL